MVGDFPIAMNFFLHEFIYELKNRLSSANNGVLSFVDAEQADKVIWALLSKKEREKQRNELFEKIKKDTTHRYDYLVRSLGFMGVFKDVFDAPSYNGIYKVIWTGAENRCKYTHNRERKRSLG